MDGLAEEDADGNGKDGMFATASRKLTVLEEIQQASKKRQRWAHTARSVSYCNQVCRWSATHSRVH